MKKEDVKVGHLYHARVSGEVVVVRVDEIDEVPGNRHQKAHTVWHGTNLKTNRKVTIDSPQRFVSAASTVSGVAASSGATPLGPGTGLTLSAPTTAGTSGPPATAKTTSEPVEMWLTFRPAEQEGSYEAALEDGPPPFAKGVSTSNEPPSQSMGAVDTSPLRPGETPEDRLVRNVEAIERQAGMTLSDLAKSITKRTEDLIADARAKGHTVTQVHDSVVITPPERTTEHSLTKRDRDVLNEMRKEGEPGYNVYVGDVTPAVAQELLRTDITYPPPREVTGTAVESENVHTLPTPQKEGVGSIVARKLREAKEREQADDVGERQDAQQAPPAVPVVQEHAVRQLVRREGQHLIVRARAGTGKTFTLVQGVGEVRGVQSLYTPSPQQAQVWDRMRDSLGARSIGYAAFNSSIVEETRKKMPPGVDVMTCHSMGHKAVMRAFGLSGRDVVNKLRVSELAAQLLGGDLRTLMGLRPGFLGVGGCLQQVVKFCKMRLVGVDERSRFDGKAVDWGREIDWIVRNYDLDVAQEDEEDVYRLVPALMELCLDPSRDGHIDYDDQIWLAVVGRGIRVWEYDVLCVDEGQDLNPAQQRLVQKAARRLVLCGDDRQAIYGFTGADTDGLPTFERILGATNRGVEMLPLTVTRRCGKAIVEEARKLVPDFEAHPDNGPGFVGEARYPLQHTGSYWDGSGKTTRLPYDQTYLKDVEPGDLVLCRVNSHLVLQCTEHHKRGNRAFILGREYGDQYKAFVEKMDARDVPELIQKVSDWRHEELRKEQAKRNPSDNRVINIEARADTILALAEGMRTIPEILERVNDLFVADANRPGVLHSSIHKAKGLEAKNVWFLMPRGGECPHPMAKTSWAIQQEWNLKYVGITRAIETQTFVY